MSSRTFEEKQELIDSFIESKQKEILVYYQRKSLYRSSYDLRIFSAIRGVWIPRSKTWFQIQISEYRRIHCPEKKYRIAMNTFFFRMHNPNALSIIVQQLFTTYLSTQPAVQDIQLEITRQSLTESSNCILTESGLENKELMIDSREYIIRPEKLIPLIRVLPFFLQLRASKTKANLHSSYGLKHFIERFFASNRDVEYGNVLYYISNSDLILAMFHLKYEYKMLENCINVQFYTKKNINIF